jgi:hypothetical protein
VDRNKAVASGKECGGKRIEWTGAGGDYFLAVVVDQDDEVIAERWGTRKEVLAWMKRQWPHLPVKYVPMVYGRGCGSYYRKGRTPGPVALASSVGQRRAPAEMIDYPRTAGGGEIQAERIKKSLGGEAEEPKERIVLLSEGFQPLHVGHGLFQPCFEQLRQI